MTKSNVETKEEKSDHEQQQKGMKKKLDVYVSDLIFQIDELAAKVVDLKCGRQNMNGRRTNVSQAKRCADSTRLRFKHIAQHDR